jgi:hypothetical protein
MVVLLLVFVALSIYGLRENNIQMIALRNQLMTADKNDGDVSGDLNKLRHFIYDHMNTDPSSGSNGIYPPIQLKYTYQRLKAKAQEAITAENNQYYAQSVAYCNRLYPNSNATEASLKQMATCEEQYFEAQPRAAAAYVAPALYQFDFISPIWSPDLAGLSIAISVIILLILIAMFVFDRFIY